MPANKMTRTFVGAYNPFSASFPRTRASPLRPFTGAPQEAAAGEFQRPEAGGGVCGQSN